MDWNARNMFCAACGKRTVSEEAGHKRSCISDPQEETKCISHTGIQNFSYPRTGKFFFVYTRSIFETNLKYDRCCCNCMHRSP